MRKKINTLIIATSPLTKLEYMTLCLILCESNDEVDPARAVKNAFSEWAHTTDEGEKYIQANGTNWGDSLNIPDKILAEHGIQRYVALLGVASLDGCYYDHKITVDHDEKLV